MPRSHKNRKTDAKRKERYQSPKLSAYGEVRHLTTGGSQDAKEGIGEGGQMDKEVRV